MTPAARYRELKRLRDQDSTLGLLYTPIDELDDESFESLGLLATPDDERDYDDDGSLELLHGIDDEDWP